MTAIVIHFPVERTHAAREAARKLTDDLGLKGRARGVVLGRYRHVSLAGNTILGTPITSLEELNTLVVTGMLRARPGCGMKTYAEIVNALTDHLLERGRL